MPDNHSVFTNDGFRGEVNTDENGNRRNSEQGTFIAGYRNLFFIGDSTTASLEVNDDKTVPALLEQKLRAAGQQVNVINLGVRGYGTDQSVLKAIRMAARIQPEEIIYMYVDNDIYNNNTLKKPRRKYGKGAFIRHHGSQAFMAHNIPVPKYSENAAALVILDENCSPIVHETELPTTPAGPAQRLKDWARNNLYTYRAVLLVARTILHNVDSEADVQSDMTPYNYITGQGKTWHNNFRHAYEDNAYQRQKCHDYFADQISFLLAKPATEIPGLKHIHLVQFPDLATINLLRENRESPNSVLFNSLLEKHIIDSYTSLPELVLEKNIDIEAMRCPGDAHFCATGNEWIASAIFSAINHTRPAKQD